MSAKSGIVTAPTQSFSLGDGEHGIWSVVVDPMDGSYIFFTTEHKAYRARRRFGADMKREYVTELFAGTGTAGAKCGRRLGEAELFVDYHFCACIGEAGSILISQQGIHSLRMIKGDFITDISLANSDGKPLIDNPHGVTYDPSTGNIYVFDMGTGYIKTIAKDGSISTIAGGASYPNASIPTAIEPVEALKADFRRETQLIWLPKDERKRALFPPSPIPVVPSETANPATKSSIFFVDYATSSYTTNYCMRQIDLELGTVRNVLNMLDVECFALTPSGDLMLQYSLAELSHATYPENLTWWQFQPSENFRAKNSMPVYLEPEEGSGYTSDPPTGTPIIPCPPVWESYMHYGACNPYTLEFATISPKSEQSTVVVADTSSLPMWIPKETLRRFDLTTLLTHEMTPARLLPIELSHASLSCTARLPNMIPIVWAVDKAAFVSTIQEFPFQSPESFNFAVQALLSNPILYFSTLKPSRQTADLALDCALLFIELGVDFTAPTRCVEVTLNALSGLACVEWFASVAKRAPKINTRLMRIFAPYLIQLESEILNRCDDMERMCVDEWTVESRQDQDLNTEPLFLACNGGFGESRLEKHLAKIGQSMKWIEKTGDVPPGRFRLGIQGYPLFLDVSEVVLYSQWAYFRTMIDSGLSESHQRFCEFPSDLPPQALLAIVKALHGLHEFGLQKIDAEYLLEHAELFKLSLESSVASLLEDCRRIINPSPD